MKVEITKTKRLEDLNRTVAPGTVLESPKDAPEPMLRAYVNNGIAKELVAAPAPAKKEVPLGS
jgi:hypothetical protein